MSDPKQNTLNPRKEMIHEIIFEADTRAGRLFDIVLLIAIIGSILIVMLESVESIDQKFHDIFLVFEWIFTIFFTIEYALRLYCVYSPRKYATSFFGVVDLLAILPTYLELLVPQTHYLVVVRALRILRVFRILKLASFLKEGRIIMLALRKSRPKLIVFISFILILVTILGSIMYVVEGGQDNGFDSIPRSIYWAIVTLTTVGYGDISPSSALGQFIAAIVMLLGYAVIAVPTGIVSADLVNTASQTNTQACRNCGEEGHDDDAVYCKYCGSEIHPDKSPTKK